MTDTQHITSLLERYNINAFYHNERHGGGFSVLRVGAVYNYPDEYSWQFPIKLPFCELPARTIVAPRPWLNVYSYWVCLHEIGHIFHGHTSAFPNSTKKEIEAWTFALDHSHKKPSWTIRPEIAMSLRFHPYKTPGTDDLIDHFCMRRLKG